MRQQLNVVRAFDFGGQQPATSGIMLAIVPRHPQSRSEKGSQRWLQEVVNGSPGMIDSAIGRSLALAPEEHVEWLSPLAADEYAEYQDVAFLKKLGVSLQERPLADFWPPRGPHWDGLAKTSRDDSLLIEAKSHAGELRSPPSAASPNSIARIRSSLDEVKRYLGVPKDVDWSGAFYQYTNRLAHLYLLRVINGLPAYLVFVYFVRDSGMGGPSNETEWRRAIEDAHASLRLPERHALAPYVVDAFIDVAELDRP